MSFHAKEHLQRMAGGWSPSHAEAASELLAQLHTLLRCDLDPRPPTENAVAFVADLSVIRLHGTHEMPCLIVGGSREQAELAVREFWRHAGAAGKLPILLAVSPAATAASAALIPSGDAVVLDGAAIEEWFRTPDPVSFLKSRMRAQVPLQRLIPYNVTTPAVGGMFFGRRHELARLLYENEVSFAIAGPGRAGKTSLLRKYRRELRRRRDPRMHRLHEIDCFTCDSLTEDEIARHLAMTIAPTSQADKVDRHGLLRFLRLQNHAAGGSLDLLVDEVDTACLGETFRLLGDAVKAGICRVVLCGKGTLLRMMLTNEQALAGRLALIRPEPLDAEAATALIVDPLTDLGFKLSVPAIVLERVFRLTGRQPQLLQNCARRLIEYALQDRTEIIGGAHLDRLEKDFTTFFEALCPLRDMANHHTRLAALLLLRQGGQEVTLNRVEGLLRDAGLEADYQVAMDVCGDLVINNVLTWERGRHQLANPGLPELVRKMGFLDSAIARVTAELEANRPVAAKRTKLAS